MRMIKNHLDRENFFIEKLENNKLSFSDEVEIAKKLLEKSRFIQDIRFFININGEEKEMLLKKELNKIKSVWRWVERIENRKTIDLADDRKRFEEKMEQLERDAEFGKEIRKAISEGEINIIEKDKTIHP